MVSNSRVVIRESLEGGWVKEAIRRNTGVKPGRWDIYLLTPWGTRLRSGNELLSYVQKRKIQIDPLIINFKKPEGAQGPEKKIPGRKKRKEEKKPDSQGPILIPFMKQNLNNVKTHFTPKEHRYLQRQFSKVPNPSSYQVSYMAQQLHSTETEVYEYFAILRNQDNKEKPIKSLGITELSSVPFPTYTESEGIEVINENAEIDVVF